IEKWFDDLGAERDGKVRRYCAVIEMMQISAEACAQEVRRLERLKHANENGAKRLKDRLQLFFEQHQIRKLDLGIFRPRIQANGGVRGLLIPAEWDDDPASAPERYHKIAIFLNRELIREDAEGFEAELERLQSALAASEISFDEYEAAVHLAQK